MIEQPSRHRKKPIATTNAAASSRNLKLICRFNGAFHIIESQQSFKNVRYIGGETRIISVDRRSINFSKLCFRISQLCPNLRSFSLKYHLPCISRSGSESDINGNSKDKDLSPLVSISSDDDVFLMVTEYDKLELYGKQNFRLWIYVLSSSSDSISGTQCDGDARYLRHELFLAKQCPLSPRYGNLHFKCVSNLNDLRVNLMCDQVDYGNENMNSRENCLASSMGCYHNGVRNQRVYSYRNCNHHHYNHQSGRLDGRVVSVGKCHHGLKPKPNISKQGQSLRSYFCSNSKKSLGNSREKSGSDVSLFENLAYFSASGGAGAGNQPLLYCNAVKSPSSVVENMECQQDLLTGSPYKPHEVSCHSDPENNYVASISDKLLTFGHQNVVSNSSNGPSVECKKGLIDSGEVTTFLSHLKNDTHNLEMGVASSLELLDNLSLSSKRVEPPAPSIVIGDFHSSLLKPKSEHLDILDGNSSTGYKADKLGVVKSNSYTLHATGMEKAETKEEIRCPSVIDGISDDLATRQLQAIKNSDLEHIKELGSGTYGTVYYGKWKGSDVAIKRIKPSCFVEDSSVKDRLVADFWKEAHILAQLHHPNIVAFYGVVTDGPAKTLGAVTE